jgi:hypothetical protein
VWVATLQVPLEQSEPTRQVLPVAQGGQTPPQSTSVSVPFLTASAQLAAWQLPAEQTPLLQSEGTAQDLPSGHGAQVPPPQSTAVSAPFLTPSAQLGAWQFPLEQTPLVQSLPDVQLVRQAEKPHTYRPQELVPPARQVPAPSHVAGEVATPPLQLPGVQAVPALQSAQLPAPLQKSVEAQVATGLAVQAFRGSAPATTLVQVPGVALHCWQPPAQAVLQQTPSTQKPLAQVPFDAQAAPCGEAQTPARQAPLEQSPLTVQALPAAQPGQTPPQSTSVSTPFLTASAQLAGWQVPPLQTPLVQSPGAPQVLPSGHGAQVPPPQSTAVSAPFFTPSTQLATRQDPAAQTPLGQSAPPTHWTHAPAPSHRTPPLEVHAEPAGLGDWLGTPATQTPTLQSPLGDGRSTSSLAATRSPLPSHWFDLQSPGFGSPIFVPAAFGVSAHCPPAQAAERQALDGTGQVVASVQTGALGELVPPQPMSPRTTAATSAAERGMRMESPGGEPRRRS